MTDTGHRIRLTVSEQARLSLNKYKYLYNFNFTVLICRIQMDKISTVRSRLKTNHFAISYN